MPLGLNEYAYLADNCALWLFGPRQSPYVNEQCPTIVFSIYYRSQMLRNSGIYIECREYIMVALSLCIDGHNNVYHNDLSISKLPNESRIR